MHATYGSRNDYYFRQLYFKAPPLASKPSRYSAQLPDITIKYNIHAYFIHCLY